MKVLCVGPLWRGSNAGGLFRALSRQGVIIEVVDEFYHLSLQHEQHLLLRAATKILRPCQILSFNRAIIQKFRLFEPEVLFVYKGSFVLPSTLNEIKSSGSYLANFYPDVSMFSHGKLLPRTLPLYDLIYTTKTFGIKDLKTIFGVENSVFIPHGFDPDIHRRVEGFQSLKEKYQCDVSFIGTWSKKKESYLAFVKEKLPDINLRIWGNQWENCSSSILKTSIQYTEIIGDLYALAIQSSSINLGILSEKVKGASSGDRITSRTFHITGSGGFLLHERNEESVQYFEDGKEASFFDSLEELVEHIRYYLENERERKAIQEAGYQRALKEHSLDNRALEVLHHFEKLLI